MLDTTRTHETPESIELSLNVAGLVPRASAWLIDLLIRGGIYFAFFILLSALGEFGQGIFLIIFFLVEWFYPVFFEVRTGATPGKKKYNLMVCQDNGTPISWQSSITRNLLRVADFLPMLFGFGILSMLFHKDFKRLGDIAAGTIVVYQDGQDIYDVPDAKPVPLPVPVTWTQQQAMLEFAARLETFSPERQQELASSLGDYFQASSSQKGSQQTQHYQAMYRPVEQVVGYANYILHGNQHAARSADQSKSADKASLASKPQASGSDV